MCEIELLNKNELGCVTRCSLCGDFQIGFGSLIYILTSEEFEIFLNRINSLYDEHSESLISYGEKLYITTDSKKMILAFNMYELKLLLNLLNETSILLEVKELLNIEF